MRKNELTMSTYEIITEQREKKEATVGFFPTVAKKRGIVLLFHREFPAVPSPMRGLTSEFEMGSGVSPALWTPQSETKLNSIEMVFGFAYGKPYLSFTLWNSLQIGISSIIALTRNAENFLVISEKDLKSRD